MFLVVVDQSVATQTSLVASGVMFGAAVETKPTLPDCITASAKALAVFLFIGLAVPATQSRASDSDSSVCVPTPALPHREVVRGGLLPCDMTGTMKT
jgi:hypothetical protein